MRKLVYIAGPYAGDVGLNVSRALRLGRYAVDRGLCPVVPHLMGRAGLYGDPHEQDDGRCRRAAMECGVALARCVGASGGLLWAIARDDETLSVGTRFEIDAWGHAATVRPKWRTWSRWMTKMEGG